MPRRKFIPTYRLHRQSGQAVVTLPDGFGKRRDVLLGQYGSQESRAEYARVLGEWETAGRRLPPRGAEPSAPDLTVNELLLHYLRWAEGHYRDTEGNVSRELENVTLALRPLKQLHGHTAAREFGPVALRAVQADMVNSGLSRGVVNARVNRVRRVFKWAASFELVPSATHEALCTVAGLQRGRSQAREADPIRPAPETHVSAALPHLPAPVRAMTELQLLTGMRAGEVMVMRAIDLNTAGAVWTYRPASHKNRHRGLERVIFLGPQAQDVVKPFLTTNLDAYLFSPRTYVEDLRRRRAAQRQTKRTPSEANRRRKSTPQRQPGERYNRRSYRVAIVRACQRAGVPAWSPLQLRHTAATRIRAQYGLEAAKTILGHTRVETS
jgi:integrase